MTEKKDKTTSPAVASIAGGLLSKPKTPKKVKTVAASAVSQAEGNKKTDKTKK